MFYLVKDLNILRQVLHVLKCIICSTMNLQDVDEIGIEYPSIFELMSDLKGMGESSADQRRQNVLRRDTLFVVHHCTTVDL